MEFPALWGTATPSPGRMPVDNYPSPRAPNQPSYVISPDGPFNGSQFSTSLGRGEPACFLYQRGVVPSVRNGACLP